jgi:hypothetical protein
VEAESKLLLVFPLFETCADMDQIMSAAPIREGRVEGIVFADNRGGICKQDHQSWYWREEKADKAPSTASLDLSLNKY